MNPSTPAQTFRARLQRHEPSLVINVDHPSPGLVEALATMGIHAVLFDTEQGSPDVESLENMARAARLRGTCSLIRTFNSEPWAIERLSQRGADGLVVPRAETVDDVQRIVSAFEYCAAAPGEERLLIVQLEHVNLLSHLSEIADMTAIDCVFIGPVDLSKSMGYKGDYRTPQVAQAIDRAIASLRERGKPVGMLVKPGDIAPWIHRGASFLYAHANDLLKLGTAALCAQIQPAQGTLRVSE